jgi:hypothetical protein
MLAIELLHLLLKKAQEMELLGHLAKSCERFRISLYADDVALFIRPMQQDLQITQQILTIFTEASCLKINLEKPNFTQFSVGTLTWDFSPLRTLCYPLSPANIWGSPFISRNPQEQCCNP